MRRGVVTVGGAAEAARKRRNQVIHQDWLLRGPDAMRPVADLNDVAPQGLPAHLEAWERESKRPKTGSRYQPTPLTSFLRRPSRTFG